MENFAYIALISAGPLLVAVITTLNAKKTNAMWRERRAARLAVREASKA
ncbi:MAG: hypothetical protein ACTH8F_07770 [Microbacterium sp.]